MFARSTQRFLPLVCSVFALSLFAMMTGCETGAPNPAAVDAFAPDVEGTSTDLDDLSASAKARAFFPLEQGNRWVHARKFRVQIFPDGGEPEEPVTVRARIKSRINGTEVRDGVTYEIMEQHWNEAGNEFTQWIRMRQDRAGLYEATVAITEPPVAGLTVRSQSARPVQWTEIRRALSEQVATQGLHPGFLRAVDAVQERHERIIALLAGATAPDMAKASRHGGPGENELTRLAYPLHRKASWTVLEGGTATVTRREVLDLPSGRAPAWRIRLDWDFLEPGDRVVLWYGRCGELQFKAHVEGTATDDDGQRIGTFVSNEREVLVDLDVKRGGCR